MRIGAHRDYLACHQAGGIAPYRTSRLVCATLECPETSEKRFDTGAGKSKQTTPRAVIQRRDGGPDRQPTRAETQSSRLENHQQTAGNTQHRNQQPHRSCSIFCQAISSCCAPVILSAMSPRGVKITFPLFRYGVESSRQSINPNANTCTARVHLGAEDPVIRECQTTRS